MLPKSFQSSSTHFLTETLFCCNSKKLCSKENQPFSKHVLSKTAELFPILEVKVIKMKIEIEKIALKSSVDFVFNRESSCASELAGLDCRKYPMTIGRFSEAGLLE